MGIDCGILRTGEGDAEEEEDEANEDGVAAVAGLFTLNGCCTG